MTAELCGAVNVRGYCYVREWQGREYRSGEFDFPWLLWRGVECCLWGCDGVDDGVLKSWDEIDEIKIQRANDTLVVKRMVRRCATREETLERN